ncbi:MAG: hypothetical protein IPI81_11040 [Flavobacteriales bacterium]|nr:hypothetical protein [Flavobacteriales bacterium]MCC6936777.1 hypothetical protein [Flavobacteriales bacterium]
MAIAYIFTIIVSLVFLLIAALVANMIKFEGGANPKDAKKRRMWFWVLGILAPAVAFTVGFFLLAPTKKVEYDNFMSALPIGTGIGFALYVVLGFVFSRMFKHGKMGNWF